MLTILAISIYSGLPLGAQTYYDADNFHSAHNILHTIRLCSYGGCSLKSNILASPSRGLRIADWIPDWAADEVMCSNMYRPLRASAVC